MVSQCRRHEGDSSQGVSGIRWPTGVPFPTCLSTRRLTFYNSPRRFPIDYFPSTIGPRRFTIDYWPSTIGPRRLALDDWPLTIYRQGFTPDDWPLQYDTGPLNTPPPPPSLLIIIIVHAHVAASGQGHYRPSFL